MDVTVNSILGCTFTSCGQTVLLKGIEACSVSYDQVAHSRRPVSASHMI